MHGVPMSLSVASREKLSLCVPALARLVIAASDGIDRGALSPLAPLVRDITVVCTFRGQEAQDAAFAAGRSKKPWPTSGHNTMPVRAVDLAPYPLDYPGWEENPAPLWILQGYVRALAFHMGVRLKPAIPWDAPHYELAP